MARYSNDVERTRSGTDTPRICPDGLGSQRGAVLIVALIMLLLMTLIGVTSMQVTSLEEKMAGNMRDRNLAFQAAESALRIAEDVLTAPALPNFNCSNGLLQAGDADCNGPDSSPVWDTIDWGSSQVVTVGGSFASLAANPAYVIEEMPAVSEAGASLEAGTAKDARYYRITARAVGGSDTAVVMVQSTYKR